MKRSLLLIIAMLVMYSVSSFTDEPDSEESGRKSMNYEVSNDSVWVRLLIYEKTDTTIDFKLISCNFKRKITETIKGIAINDIPEEVRDNMEDEWDECGPMYIVDEYYMDTDQVFCQLQINVSVLDDRAKVIEIGDCFRGKYPYTPFGDLGTLRRTPY